MATADYFWAKVDRTGGEDACWPWIGYRFRQGYGNCGIRVVDGVRLGEVLAHRAVMVIHHGRPITPGMHILHSCDNMWCCNPAHLREGTHQENMAERDRKGRGATGDRCGSRTHPETRPRGTAVKISKINEEIARDIQRRYAAGDISMERLGKLYGVSHNVVRQVSRGITWKHAFVDQDGTEPAKEPAN